MGYFEEAEKKRQQAIEELRKLDTDPLNPLKLLGARMAKRADEYAASMRDVPPYGVVANSEKVEQPKADD